MNAQAKPRAARAVRASDLARVLDVLATRGWTPQAVRVRPDGSVELANAPLDLPLDAPAAPEANEPNDFD